MQSKASALFQDWEEGMILSCLQGYMGRMVVGENAASAMIELGDFCFFAGQPNAALLAGCSEKDAVSARGKKKKLCTCCGARLVCGDSPLQGPAGNKLLIPKDAGWETVIEDVFGNRVNRFFRYATQKDPDAFDTAKLLSYLDALDPCYELRRMGEEEYTLAAKEMWSVDLCSQFEDYADYRRRAIGVAILHRGELVAGASPYAVYDGGIEIEIDTKPSYREKGLATVCGAKLILECLERGLYPSWDAHDLRSLALAEKLGYRLAHPYVTYALTDDISSPPEPFGIGHPPSI